MLSAITLLTLDEFEAFLHHEIQEEAQSNRFVHSKIIWKGATRPFQASLLQAPMVTMSHYPS